MLLSGILLVGCNDNARNKDLFQIHLEEYFETNNHTVVTFVANGFEVKSYDAETGVVEVFLFNQETKRTHLVRLTQNEDGFLKDPQIIK